MVSVLQESGMDRPVLVLNKHWQAIDAHPMRKALKGLVADKTRIVCPETYVLYDLGTWMDRGVREGELGIKTFGEPICTPEVIVNRYDRVPKRVVVFSRRNLWRRDAWCCGYCGCRPPNDEITIDHVVPRSQGGITVFENCVLACITCNKMKDNRTPEQAGMPLVSWQKQADGTMQLVQYRRPKRPPWSPLFAVRRQKVPDFWGKFLRDMVSQLYWNTELESS